MAAFILLMSLRGIARFYTDYLWFDSLDQAGVWRGVLGAKVVLALLFILVFFALALANLTIADRLAPAFRVSGPEDELLERYHDLVEGRAGWIRASVAGVLALIAGSGVSAEWNSWILFTNGRDFGVTDPQFGQDIGFYVFRLPFLSFVVDWLFASLLIVLIITVVAHYLNGGIRVQPPSPRVTPQVKAHLSVLLAALALVKAADYWLQRFELTTSSRGVVDGALYTDVNAQLPVLNLLVLISLAAAVLFVANIFRRGWTLPVLAVGLWMFVAIVAGGIYPQYVQSFQVRPNESARERPYIERNIEATRAALDLSDVTVQRFTPTTDVEDVSLEGAQPTIRNIRLWDPAGNVSGQAFEQLQRIRNYYGINDIDVDRYEIGGELTQVNIGARTINPGGVPGDSWEARHLAYTHGYGVVLAPSNASQGTEPDFLVGGVPPEIASEVAESGFATDNPGIYFGEDLEGYIVVGTNREEIDYQDEDNTVRTTYEGEDGVAANSLLRRIAFSLRFGDLNPLISDFMTDESRVIFQRDVVSRVEALAPFLDADADPYPVVVDGSVLWVVDLYTTTSRYPYGQEADSDQVLSRSGLNHDFNYVRNSVKATVDAYDGTVTLYVVDDEDPIIAAYQDAFPELFTPGDEMSAGLREHLRYPEDLFRIQTAAYGRYHLQDPDDFFTQEDAWRVARDPGTAGADPTTVVTDETGQATGETRAARIAPYYQILQLPQAAGGGQPADPEMVLMRPFVPYSEDDRSQLLTAFMAARMDGDSYGDLVVYEMSSRDLPDGPGIAAASISADVEVGRLETQLSESGSEVRYGNLLLVPIDNALLYVQPFYVVAEEQTRQVPQLQRVIVVFEDQVVFENTLSEALTVLFGDTAETLEQPDEDGGAEGDDLDELPGAPGGSAAQQAAALLDEAMDLFVEAEAALTDGDLGEYQSKNAEAEDKVSEAISLLQGGDEDADADDGAEAGEDGDTTTTEADTTPA
ncbi:MAG TPA: UPF0182 family protein [Egicoccus sp.]|nr:UPF0182 family protein [Egicoccus sp.]HSK23350.1 UPF0182 family protein [Egicoccus sp.]